MNIRANTRSVAEIVDSIAIVATIAHHCIECCGIRHNVLISYYRMAPSYHAYLALYSCAAILYTCSRPRADQLSLPPSAATLQLPVSYPATQDLPRTSTDGVIKTCRYFGYPIYIYILQVICASARPLKNIHITLCNLLFVTASPANTQKASRPFPYHLAVCIV